MALADLLAPALQVGATILSAGGHLARGNAARAVGQRRRQLAEFDARQLEEDAVLARGAGMRGAQDEAIKTALVNSAALARASASGAGATDPTVLQILARTAGEGSYRQMVALYEGESQARANLMKAAASRFEGETAEADSVVAKKAANTSAAATVLSGGTRVMSMYDKYWAGPKPGASGGYSSGRFLEDD